MYLYSWLTFVVNTIQDGVPQPVDVRTVKNGYSSDNLTNIELKFGVVDESFAQHIFQALKHHAESKKIYWA